MIPAESAYEKAMQIFRDHVESTTREREPEAITAYVTELQQERDTYKARAENFGKHLSEVNDLLGQEATKSSELAAENEALDLITADRDKLQEQLKKVKETCNQCEWCNKWDVKEFFGDVCGQTVCEECKDNR